MKPHQHELSVFQSGTHQVQWHNGDMQVRNSCEENGVIHGLNKDLEWPTECRTDSRGWACSLSGLQNSIDQCWVQLGRLEYRILNYYKWHQGSAQVSQIIFPRTLNQLMGYPVPSTVCSAWIQHHAINGWMCEAWKANGSSQGVWEEMAWHHYCLIW